VARVGGAPLCSPSCGERHAHAAASIVVYVFGQFRYDKGREFARLPLRQLDATSDLIGAILAAFERATGESSLPERRLPKAPRRRRLARGSAQFGVNLASSETGK
jgi:hypothetical protein